MTTTSVTTSTTSQYTVTNGNELLVASGGNVTGPNIHAGGTLVVSGGIESNAVVSSGATETVSTGSASGDQIYGTLSTVSGIVGHLTNEIVENGGNLIEVNSAVVSGTEVMSGGTLQLNGNTSGANTNTTLVSGGVLELESAKATVGGSLTFSGGGNTLEVSATISAGYGDQAVISGFSSTDKIDLTSIASAGATLSFGSSGGNEIVTVSGGGSSESFIFSGTALYNSSTMSLTTDGGSGVDLVYHSAVSSGGTTTSVTTSTASGAYTETSGNTLIVESGGSVSAATIDNGAFLIVNGGTDAAAIVSSGATATVSTGSASGDRIYGTLSTVSGVVGHLTNEIVENGGNLIEVNSAVLTGTEVLGGGTFQINGNTSGANTNTTLVGGGVLELESAKATIGGTLTFSGGGNTLDIVSIASAGYGDLAVISGFSTTDQIVVSGVGTNATLSYSTSGGNEVVTVSGGGSSSEAFVFSGTSTYTSNSLSLVTSGGAADLQYTSTTSVTTSTASGAYTEGYHDHLLVEAGGSVSAATIDDGGSLIVSGGADYAAAILAGGTETVSAGSATGDQIYGGATVDAAIVSSETVQDGGTLALSAGATASNTVLSSGGTVELASPTATLTGSLTFSDGGNTLDIAAVASSGDGEQAVISGFSSADKIVISGVGSNATLSFTTSGGNEMVTVSGSSGSESLTFVGTNVYTSNTISAVTSGSSVELETSFAASDFNILPYNPSNASAVVAGPLALYAVPVDLIAPTQLNEGFAEVDAKAAAFDEFPTSTALEADLMGDIEPVVIGPGGQLYLLDGHHTFTALEDSIWGASDPTVYVNVIANYSGDTESQFIGRMEANNWLLPLNDGVPVTVNPNTGAPIPTTLTGLTSNVYRGLEYSILKQKDSKLFTSNSNITGTTGAATPGLDKMPGLYSDFFEAAAYQDADSGRGLPYLSPGDIALATQWNLNPNSTTTLPNVSGTVHAYQLPGFILSQNVVISASIGNSTLGQTVSNGAVVPGSMEGAIDGNGTFTGVTEINAGTAGNPIYIGTPNIGLVMQVGADNKFTVTLSSTANTYIGGTTFLAGTLIIAGDGSLGAAPTETNAQFDASLNFDAEGVPDNVTAATQADNGIIFNSLSEGNGTLTIGLTAGAYTSASPFTTNRIIAVGNEAATVNVNGSYVELGGQLVTLGYDNLGLGETAGFPAFTIDDLSSGGTKTSTAGTLVLSTASPYFYGDIIIGNTGTPTVEVMSDAAMGYDGSNANLVGTVELNSGTLQTGASFSASERDINLESGSQIDLDGNTTAWGSLTDVQRTLAIVNSNATAGAITFSNLTISQTATLQLDGTADSTAYSGAETVTFTNGIVQTAASDTLILNPSSSAALGTTEKVFSDGASTQLVDGIAPVWIVTDAGGSGGIGPYDFVTYGADGYVQESGAATTLSAATGSSVVELAANSNASGSLAAYALNTNGFSVTLGAGNTLTIGDGTDDAGLILANGSAISGGTVAFGGSQGFVWLSGAATISSQITGSNGLTFSGSGAVTINNAASLSGLVTLDSGTVTLAVSNIFAGDVAGMELSDVKSHPAVPTLSLTASNAFTALNTVGTNGAINLSNGATLTLGDTVNNLSSTISSPLTETGGAVAGALTLDGSGLFDFSGGSKSAVSLGVGSTVVVNNSAQLRLSSNEFANANFGVDLNGSGTQLQLIGAGQFANAVTGTGELHLLSGTLQLTGINNSYSGGTVLELGSTLDLATSIVSTGNANITDAGGLVVFDQDTAGSYSGVISDGKEMGTGPMESGSLDIDDSTGTTDDANGNDVTLDAVQTFSGGTYVEAGTLTLGIAGALADSSGVTLGRVGGAVDGQTAHLVLAADNQLTALSGDASNSTSVVLNGHTLTLAPTATSVSSYGGTIADGSAMGAVVIDGTGTVTFTGVNTFSGGVTLDSGTLELGNSGSAGSGAITFNAGAGDPTLEIDGTVMPTNDIEGFASGGSDVIDLTSIANVSGSHADMNYATNVLTITEGSSTYTLDFNPNQSFSGDYFDLAADASGNGTDITENDVACYCRGTLIRTDRGQTPVEKLKIGDKVKTVSGASRPIKWIGRRSYGGRFILGRTDILPICIKAGALDDNLPRRDLWISPHHAMFLNGVLIEARDLVNGSSIVQAAQVDSVEYFHIELDSHDVILAEGAPSETFIDDDSRAMFHNAQEFRALYPEAAPAVACYCAPRLADGYAVEEVRRKIMRRAQPAAAHEAAPIGALRGYVDRGGPTVIAGWAQNVEHAEAPVCLDIEIDGRLIGQVLANRYRQDLDRAGLGSGRHAFEFAVPAGHDVTRGTVQVRRSLDGAAVGPSAHCSLDAASRGRVAA